jgi:rhamnosyl/mannosyltransferase
MIKVLHVFKTYFPDSGGGLERVIEQICLQSKKFAIQSDVVTLARIARQEVMQRPEGRVFRFPLSLDICSSPLSISLLYNFRQLAQNYDVLHYHFPWPFADLLQISSGLKKITVVSYHSDIVKQKKIKGLYSPLMRKFLGQVDAIVATSENYLASSQDLAKYSAKTSVIPICLAEEAYPVVTREHLDALRTRFGEHFFFFVGVLRYYKGLHVLVEAIGGSSCRCVIAGDGPMASELKQMVNRKNLGRQIKFAGEITEKDKVALLQLCRGVVFPSHLRAEAFGLTLLEGAMLGKPLISTELGTGTSYVNRHGCTGLIVPPSDPDALRSAMEFLAHNPEEAKAMGHAARKRYTELFKAPAMGRAYADLYHKLRQKRDWRS